MPPAHVLTTAALAGTALAVRRLLPLNPLPVPTGPHRVGTITRVVQGPRALPVQIWYPTDADGEAAPWLGNAAGFAEAVTTRQGIPALALAHLRWVRGTAVADVPSLGGTASVVVLAHGWTGFRAVHADLAEQLASDGHVVVAADHVGGAIAALYPDGSVVGLDPALLPAAGTPDYWTRARELVSRYADDLGAVLDAMPSLLVDVGMAPASPTVRVIGHSTGGGAAVELAARDARVAGIVGLDPWVEPFHEGLRVPTIPIVAVRSADWIGNGNDTLLAAMPSVDLRRVAGATHGDFTVLGFISPLVRLVGFSGVDPRLPHDAALAAFADLPTASARQG